MALISRKMHMYSKSKYLKNTSPKKEKSNPLPVLEKEYFQNLGKQFSKLF